MHSPPTIVRHIVRPKSAEPPRSPLLKRVQSEEKLSPSYGSDKKHLCSRKHSLEVTQEEAPREQPPREVTLQSLDENVCDAPSLSRARPVEQGCLKRPVSRKLGRQESVDELDREKLKAKVVVKKPDGFPEKQEPHQKSHGPGSDLENLSTYRLEEREKKIYPKALERSNHFDNKGALQEAMSLGSLLKGALHKQASVRASEGVTSEGAAAGHGPTPGDHGQGICDFKHASAPGTLQDTVCLSVDRSSSGKGENTEKASQAKECLRCEKLDSKLANIDYLRKKMSLEDKDDSLCPVLKPKMTSSAHESLPGNPVRPTGGQQEAPAASESRAFMSPAHMAQISAVSFVPLKALAGRVDSGVEKPGLVAPESPVRKSPSEYKLEGRSVSCLKPIEGTLDIALLSGPQGSKTELPSPEPAQSPSPASDVGPSVPPALPSTGAKKGETVGQREPSTAGFRMNKSYLLEPRFPPPSRGLQHAPAAPVPCSEPELRRDRKSSHVARSPVMVMESDPQRREGGPNKHQDHSPDTKLLPSLGPNPHGTDPSRSRSLLPPEGTTLREKPNGRESSDRGPSMARSERSAVRADSPRDPSTESYPPEAAKTNDSSRNLTSGGRTRPDSYPQTHAMEKAWGPCGKTNHRDGRDEVRSLAREGSCLQSAGTPRERELGRGRGGVEPQPEAPASVWSLHPMGTERGKEPQLSASPSLQKDGPKEPERKERPLQKHISSSSQPPLVTKELPSLAARQHSSVPSHASGGEPGDKPCAAEPGLGLQGPAKPAAGHSESGSHKPGPGPDPSRAKSKHPDRAPSSQKPSVGPVAGRESAAQSPLGPSREGKGSGKGVLDAFPALPGCQNAATHVISPGGSGPSVSLHTQGGPLDAKVKPTSGGQPPEAPEKPPHPPQQGHPGEGEPGDQKAAPASEKQNLSPKHPKPATVKDCPTLCRQTDRSPSSQAATTTGRKSEGKKCTEALYVPADDGKLEASLAALAPGEARHKGPERPAAATGKGLPEAKGKVLSPQKPLIEAGKPSGMKRSPSATGQSSFQSTAVPEKPLSSSSSFPEARPGAQEAAAISGDVSSARAGGAAAKTLPGGDGRTHMTKSDSLPTFRSSTVTLELHHPGPHVAGAAGPRDRALSVTAPTPTGETKGKEPVAAPPSQTKKQNSGREVTKVSPAQNPDRPIALSSEKDFVVRQRRGKESLRNSPHKKAS